ncbi:hypothetical protein EVAR_20213_1 [Eumeta japonica]|uniref:Uncharacterized protein n=1 Tax=Eumeta variegata TaxID=151549 RepID=A0A4C1W813_EUMVA|nr:hypothetical protein EVAR_20213_1 [Eumeta japonica]
MIGRYRCPWPLATPDESLVCYQPVSKWSTDPLGSVAGVSGSVGVSSTLRSKTKLIARAVCTREFSPPPPRPTTARAIRSLTQSLRAARHIVPATCIVFN